MERRRRARGRGIADDLITSRLHTSLLCNLRYYGVYLYEVGVLHFYLSQWPFLLLTRLMTCLSSQRPSIPPRLGSSMVAEASRIRTSDA